MRAHSTQLCSGHGGPATSAFIGGFFFLMATGCQTERVEYHRRPAFYERATNEKLPDEVVLEDGTVIKYSTDRRPGIVGYRGKDASKPFELREENEDGAIVLHSVLPGHVLANALECVRNEEYQLMWDQLLAERTKHEFERQNQDVEEFAQFFRKNRHEVAATLTRMLAGIPSQEVKFTELGEGVTRCRLRPQVAEPFQFKTVDVMREGAELKLLMIR